VSSDSVFINCPFDAEFRGSFEALLFTIIASGYRARCALEENDAADIRFDKLCRLIIESEKSVHDLSRVEIGNSGLPRFNMPFELGLYMGAKRFGSGKQRTKSALVMVTEPYRLPVYLSDLSGSDPDAHHGQTDDVIRLVRRYLHTRPDGKPLPGAKRMAQEFRLFQAAIPGIAASLEFDSDEIDPYRDYRTYLLLVMEYLRFA
jgi:hypothetical protein